MNAIIKRLRLCLMLLTSTFIIGFTACSDDNSNPPSTLTNTVWTGTIQGGAVTLTFTSTSICNVTVISEGDEVMNQNFDYLYDDEDGEIYFKLEGYTAYYGIVRGSTMDIYDQYHEELGSLKKR